MIACNRCGLEFKNTCCGSGSYPYRFSQCPRCYHNVPNPEWSRLSIIDGEGDLLATVCPGCEEKVYWKEWVFKKEEREYSCPRCNTVWSRG